MFFRPPLAPLRIPRSMQAKVYFVAKATYASLGVLLISMIVTSAYQALFDSQANTLLEAPLLLKVIMAGSFISFLSMLICFGALIAWCDVKEFILKKPN